MLSGALRLLVAPAFAACALLAAPAAPAHAQEGTLDRVESLLASGRLTDARTTLERWIADHPPGTPGTTSEQRAHALLLQGRLSSDVREAEEAYLGVVLSYPTSLFAAEALLRLGQVLVAIAMADGSADEARRGVSYLERLINDHPASPHRPLALLWLARAHQIAGDHAAACRVATDAARDVGDDPTMSPLLREERTLACARPANEPAAPPARAAARPATGDDPAPSSAARFAVQAAAVRDRTGADALADRLRRAGFDPRVVRVEGSSLHRVRIGRFAGTAEAAAVARRLRQGGFDAVVVTDANREIR